MILDLLLSLLGIILTIFIVVGIHEGAHFLVAKSVGVKVLRFSIGFGKALFTWKDKQGTEYVIAPIPLGGYVKLLDETEGPVAEEEKPFAFNRQPLYKRFAVVAAGPFSNLFLAIILYWIIFMIGFETPLPIIGNIEPRSIAAFGGLKPQQEIVSVDQKTTVSWPAVMMRLVTHIGDEDLTTIGVKSFSINNNNSLGKIEFHSLNLENWQMNALKPDPLSSLGIMPYMPEIPLIIGKIKPDSPGLHILQLGDKLLAINGKKIQSWYDLIHFISDKPGQAIHLTVQRNNKTLVLPIQLSYQRNLLFKKQGFLGIGPDFQFPDKLIRKIQYGPLEAFSHGVMETYNLSYLNLLLFWKLIVHKLSLLSLGGPITIFESAGSAFQSGLVSFLGFLAFLNVALGIINFFPIPGLDGGHLLFQLIEFILNRPISLRAQILCYRLGFIFLFFLLVQALSNDLMRLWG